MTFVPTYIRTNFSFKYVFSECRYVFSNTVYFRAFNDIATAIWAFSRQIMYLLLLQNLDNNIDNLKTDLTSNDCDFE